MDGKKEITYFAETDARSKRVKFGIKDKDRLRHVYSIGKTGMGKSTMLENMAIQDIQNGNGLAFLDPHGKTADLLLDYIPEHRIKDVVYFAPFDTEFPISFNVMEDVGPERRHLVVSGLMSAFEKIWEDAWSARMAYILQNTLGALLEYPGATLLGINRMLSDKAYRNKVVENIKDPTLRSFWVDEFAKYTDKYAAEATPAIQNKIGQFTNNPLIRNIVGQGKSSFDIRQIMDEKKILIVNLSKGLVGEGNANLLGSMLVTKMYLAAMSRADASPQEMAKLPNFYLYVDEFQSFANKSFADILSEARKYHLSLNITHQYIEQMAEEVRAAVFGNVGTMISFRVGSFDAEILEKEFAPVFTAEDIVNLGFVQVYLKLMIDGVASQPFSATTLPPIASLDKTWRAEVMENSRRVYASPKASVEEAIKEWHAPEQSAPAKPSRPLEPSGPVKPEIRRLQETIAKKAEEVKAEAPKKEYKPEPKLEPKMPTVMIEKREERVETKQEGNNALARALAEAIKTKPVVNSQPPVIKQEVKVEEKKETISLQDLRHGDKNKNKGPSPQNQNALKEALKKVASSESPVAKEEKKPEDLKTEAKQVEKKIKEIPEDVLRSILKSGQK